jgi:hypothetical protein
MAQQEIAKAASALLRPEEKIRQRFESLPF